MHLFNEIDPKAAAWLRELMAEGLIPQGIVDERSIADIQADDLKGFTQVHLFAGIGGWPLALRMAGWSDERPVWTGSCPCQPFSASGRNEGFADDRHLWPHMFRLIRECRPECIFGEQVERAIAHGWLDLVFDDLEREGYACGQAVLPACSVGARHIRQRIWWVADSAQEGRENCERQSSDARFNGERPAAYDGCEVGWRDRWASEPGMGRVVHGVFPGNSQVQCYGNAIVPELAAEFIRAYREVH
jgi:DNA (cytosine-5)-methyltransferase 1